MQESEGEWGRPPRGQGAKGVQKDEQGHGRGVLLCHVLWAAEMRAPCMALGSAQGKRLTRLP